MNVAVVGHVRHPIKQPFMGGMEAHCDSLVRGLIAAGHEVRLFASGDSAADLPLRPIAATAYEAVLPWSSWNGRPELRDWLLNAYLQCWTGLSGGAFSIIHNNSLFPDLIDWAQRDRVAMVTSLHVPPFTALFEAVQRAAGCPWLKFTVPSEQQISLWPSETRAQIVSAWNGIDCERWRFRNKGNGRGVWCGRVTPTKGTVEALVAASQAGIGLDVIGPVDCHVYWEKVETLLRPPHRYLGHLAADALVEAVGNASVMVATPMWDEPFGLTMVEAMSCGVPVAALRRGAVPEVLGESGVIVNSPRELPAAILKAMTYSRNDARARVEANFTIERMVGRYERSYALAMSGALPASASSASSTRALLA